jgi:osmoprotectant transport system substrate-binding protein
MTLSRAHALGLIGAAALLPSCSGGAGSGPTVRVGSKNFTEEFVIAEIYAQALEAKGFKVDRSKFNLGSTQIAMAALQHGDIDLYPEYTGTGLIDVLHMAPLRDPKAIYTTVRDAFAKRYRLAWLTPSPMNDSQALATTKAIAKRYGITTLSKLAPLAPQLRLATIPEFTSRADGLPGLRRFYGGFAFKEVKSYDIGLKYDALLQGGADVATAFTTDGAIAANDLVVIADDRHFWPAYNVAPVVRQDALAAHPTIATILDAISPSITDVAARQMNYAVEHDKADPADVAAKFLKEHAL